MKEPLADRGEAAPPNPSGAAGAEVRSRGRAIPVPSSIRFTRAICGDLGQAERREWWIANGLGGYAGGTIAGSLTRRYHGLLIAPVASPLGRRLILAKADATVVARARSWPLFTNRWKSGAVSPAGHIRIGSFHLDYSTPVWTFEIGEYRIEARVWMEPGAHTVYAAWRLLPQPQPAEHALSLRVTLLANDRDHHGTMTVGGFAPEIAVEGERLSLTDKGGVALSIRGPGGSIVPKREWYRDFAARGRARPRLDRQSSVRGRGHAAAPAGTMVRHRCEPSRRACGRSRGGARAPSRSRPARRLNCDREQPRHAGCPAVHRPPCACGRCLRLCPAACQRARRPIGHRRPSVVRR